MALCPKSADIDVFREFLDKLDFSLKLETEKGKTDNEQDCTSFKGYPRYKTIFCYNAALHMLIINFLFEEKIAFHSRYIYLGFCVFVKFTDSKIRDVIIDITAKWRIHLCLFLLNPKCY